MIRIVLEGKEYFVVDLDNDEHKDNIKNLLKQNDFQNKISNIQILDENKKFKAQLEKPKDYNVIWSIGKIGFSQMNLYQNNNIFKSEEIGEIISYFDPKENYKKIIKYYNNGKIVHSKTKYNKIKK